MGLFFNYGPLETTKFFSSFRNILVRTLDVSCPVETGNHTKTLGFPKKHGNVGVISGLGMM